MTEGAEKAKERNPQGQRVRIYKRDVHRHDPTLHCPRCEAIVDKRKAENHSEECRAWFVKIFKELEEGVQLSIELRKILLNVGIA